jgi:hypothetical protein
MLSRPRLGARFSVGLRVVVMYPGAYTSVNSHDTPDEEQR